MDKNFWCVRLKESQWLSVPFAQNSVLSSLLSITLGFKIFKLRFLAYSNIFCVRQGMWPHHPLQVLDLPSWHEALLPPEELLWTTKTRIHQWHQQVSGILRLDVEMLIYYLEEYCTCNRHLNLKGRNINIEFYKIDSFLLAAKQQLYKLLCMSVSVCQWKR